LEISQLRPPNHVFPGNFHPGDFSTRGRRPKEARRLMRLGLLVLLAVQAAFGMRNQRRGGSRPSHLGSTEYLLRSCHGPRASPFKSQTTLPARRVSSQTSFCEPSMRPPRLSTKPNLPCSRRSTATSASDPTDSEPRSSW